MGIFRSNNPLDYDAVDGIVIDERAPDAQVRGVGSGTALMVGQFQRGTDELKTISGNTDYKEEYGLDLSYSGAQALRNKAFSTLKLVRVVASDAAKGSLTLNDSVPEPALTISAKHEGLYGENIKVSVSSGVLTVKDESEGADAIFAQESHDISDLANLDLSSSKLIDVVVIDDSKTVADLAETALSGASDGTLVDTDYEAAIAKASAEQEANVVFLDESNSIRNGYLKVHAAETQERMVICHMPEGTTKAQIIAEADNLRDSDGRIILAWNAPKHVINGQVVWANPAAYVASVLSQSAPNIDPADVDNVDFLAGVVDLEYPSLKRQDYIDLMNAGIMAFEKDSDIGYKIKSGIVTQILSSEKVTVLRRRMADYLTNSIGRALKAYQNKPNTAKQRTAIASAVLNFDEQNIRDGILPSDNEVQNGNARLIDAESENTNESIAAGRMVLLYKRRIYSSMRFIVLKAEVGQSVVVTEA